MEEATLPSVEIDVAKGEGIETFEATPKQPSVKENPVKESSDTNKNMYHIYATALGAFVLGILIAVFVIRSKEKKINHKKEAMKALQSNDFRKAADEIVAWGRDEFPGKRINNLGDVGKAFGSKEFAKELDAFDNMLYSGKTATFAKQKFYTALGKASKKRFKKEGKNPLPDLYK
jgi:methyl-accepting chemotaxis protein